MMKYFNISTETNGYFDEDIRSFWLECPFVLIGMSVRFFILV